MKKNFRLAVILMTIIGLAGCSADAAPADSDRLQNTGTVSPADSGTAFKNMQFQTIPCIFLISIPVLLFLLYLRAMPDIPFSCQWGRDLFMQSKRSISERWH